MARERNALFALLLPLILALAWSAGEAAAEQPSADAPVVAAASDLQFALEQIAAAYEAQSGQAIRLVFGSSGNFARQIRQGAPFQIFLSADEKYVLDLARDGLTRGEGRLYAVGRIVLFVPHGSALEADGSLDDLGAALADGRLTRFAIANPEHAPYGLRAEEALRHAGLWDAIRPSLVFGENVSQAAQFAASSNAEGGIIAHSLAVSPRLAALGTFELIPEAWHAPLNQRMALLKEAGPAAERFHAWLQQPAARGIFRKYGFVLPAETSGRR